MSHPSGSNRRPTVYKTVALPTELGWPKAYVRIFYTAWQAQKIKKPDQ